MSRRVYIETKRLIIRQWEDKDLLPFFKLNSCPEVMKFYPKLLSEKESSSFIYKARTQIDEKGYSFWALELKSSGDFVGTIGINDVLFEAPFSPSVEIGWRLGKKYWRQGLGTEGAKSVLDYAFNNLCLDEIVSFTSSINIPSIKLMEKIGMRRDKSGDFDHPNVESCSPLRKHVLYRLGRVSK